MARVALGSSPAACPAPLAEVARVQLGHGSGGRMSAALLAVPELDVGYRVVVAELS